MIRSHKIGEMFDEGKSVEQIAKELGITAERVENALDRDDGYEVTTRREPEPYKPKQTDQTVPMNGGIGYQRRPVRRKGPKNVEIQILPRVKQPGEGKRPSRNPSGLGKGRKPAEHGTTSGYWVLNAPTCGREAMRTVPPS